MKTIFLFLFLTIISLSSHSQSKVGDHWAGGIVVTYGQTGLMITEADVPSYKSFYPIQEDVAKACRVGGFDDWRIPTLEEWSLIRQLFRMYPVPRTGLQPQTGLDPYFMYCAGDEYMVSVSPGRNPNELAKTRYKGGTMYGNLRLIRTYRRGITGTSPVPVGRMGDPYLGGTIFHLSADGQHGIVFSPNLGRGGWGGANQACQAYQGGGWRLPTIDELLKIRSLMIYFIKMGVTNQYKISGVHWSSTQADTQYNDLIFNWTYEYPPGATSPTQPAYFRAVRDF